MGAVSSGGRAARALRLLVVLVLVVAVVEYWALLIVLLPQDKRYQRLFPSAPRQYNKTVLLNMTRPIKSDVTRAPLMLPKIMEGIKNLVTAEEELKVTEPKLPLCDAEPPGLGPITVNKTALDLKWVEKKYPEIRRGGWYAPPNCTARHKVAIIVPYRDRQQHLPIFLNHMHPFLMKQQLEYGIFIVEQAGTSEFNRAKLMNVGFAESQKLRAGGWQCFVFHDIDLLPLDERNMYSCPRQPRHMSAAVDVFNYMLPYEEIFGGVSAMTLQQFIKLNGYSNKYWGWGGEDDDMFYRIEEMDYHMGRYRMPIARYAMLDHEKASGNSKRHTLLKQTSKIFQNDGLSNLEYEVLKIVRHPLYTHILANIDFGRPEHDRYTMLRAYLQMLLFGDTYY